MTLLKLMLMIVIIVVGGEECFEAIFTCCTNCELWTLEVQCCLFDGSEAIGHQQALFG